MVILQWGNFKGFPHIISSNSQGTRLSVCPPGITITQLAIKHGNATCITSYNPRDFVNFYQYLRHNWHISPAVKHGPDNNFWEAIPTKSHVKKRTTSYDRWRRKFLFLLFHFKLWHQVRQEWLLHMAGQFILELALTHDGLPFDTAPATTHRE